MLRKNWLFTLQVLCHLALTSLAVLALVLRHSVDKEDVYGYEILDVVSALVAWPLCLVVLLVERNFQLPAAPSHGHGVVLITTWTSAFVLENFNLLSLNNQAFFFDLTQFA